METLKSRHTKNRANESVGHTGTSDAGRLGTRRGLITETIYSAHFTRNICNHAGGVSTWTTAHFPFTNDDAHGHENQNSTLQMHKDLNTGGVRSPAFPGLSLFSHRTFTTAQPAETHSSVPSPRSFAPGCPPDEL